MKDYPNLKVKVMSGIKPCVMPTNAGYPNNIPNTQTKKMKGAGAATKGTGFSNKSN
tara:strand:- start:735 stop:902 length:168 start_codon:yes stop_codon:yes gene_type:complete